MGSIIRISSIVYLLACLQIQGQQVLQKSEAIALTLENNYGIKTANNNVIIAENNSKIESRLTLLFLDFILRICNFPVSILPQF